MRDYARVSPLFWIKGSGKRLRGDPHAQLVALYLVTCSTANMIGIYYLSLPSVVHETGLPLEEVERCLDECAAADFAHYDPESELVWVPNMATYQIGEHLHPDDKAKRKGVVNALKPFASHRFYRAFVEKYDEAYGLELASTLPAADDVQLAPTRHPEAPGGTHQAPTRPCETLSGSPDGAPHARAHDPDLSLSSISSPADPKIAVGESTGARLRGVGAMTAPPDDVPIDDDLLGRCAMAGAPPPKREDVAECLTNARKNGYMRADWREEVVSWMLRRKRFDARDRMRAEVAAKANEDPRRPAVPVQPSADAVTGEEAERNFDRLQEILRGAGVPPWERAEGTANAAPRMPQDARSGERSGPGPSRAPSGRPGPDAAEGA